MPRKQTKCIGNIFTGKNAGSDCDLKPIGKGLMLCTHCAQVHYHVVAVVDVTAAVAI
ncbi:uncharacterized protein EHS24_004469 [Apiotrichum porosum]|uniref:Uncharacterized protein n=1 Tax=Apiotrichum porosum TaxID=105984 RepID=A0A427Y592_9TREE|nr:uncharacterized protein EHS24_004469 [Apiotrichum porosum]RSH86232.1 hypothetical protein EHS24_004469 [Apiotrichum porosum]